MLKENKREHWIDIAKGLGIILVVAGHEGNQFTSHYFFWFHMPLFFILSGYLFKHVTSASELKALIFKRAKQLLIPYFLFFLLIALLNFFFVLPHNKTGTILFFKDILRSIYGGDILTDYFAVFWFITCLFLTQIAFAAICLILKSNIARISIISLSFALAHIQILLHLTKFPIPWAADIVLITIAYYGIGYYSRNIISTFKKLKFSIPIIITSIIIVILAIFHKIQYNLDLKQHVYTNIALDLIIPVVLSFTICYLSQLLSMTLIKKTLANLGKHSLTIMYLHVPLNLILKLYFPSYGLIIFVLVGTLIPYVFSILIEKSNLLRFLFHGFSEKTPQKLLSQT
jgi:fucose 4-O-acetylase-like acetyltransferase